MPGFGPTDGEPLTPAEAAAAELAERLAKSEAELADTKDKLLRALAETENIRRRAQRDTDDARKYAASKFAGDMIDAADNLRRALASVEGLSVQDERIKALLDGVAATERSLIAAFERHGMKPVAPKVGDRFDPNLHEAMFEVPGTGQPGGTIVQVVQSGYQMHDRLLRAAMVGVAKSDGAPKVDQKV